MPDNPTKEHFRHMNKLAVEYNRSKAEPALKKHEDKLIQYIANGEEIVPEKVKPKLVHVCGNKTD